MLANIVANSAQLAALSRVVEEYCRIHSIVSQGERERIGRRVLALFGEGVQNETELAIRLDETYRTH